jgi:SAM-dependent methyltransferase
MKLDTAAGMGNYSYEESVQWVREQPELANAIWFSYLDRDNRVAAQRFEQSEEFTEIRALLGLDEGRRFRVLDLGCGNGIASYAFARRGHDVVALDPDLSEDVGLAAISRLLPDVAPGRIETQQGFAESLPFPAATFDVVYTRQALHHFRDLAGGLKQCARVLKPGGRLLATREHVVDNDQQLQAFLEAHLLHKMHGGENAHPLATYRACLEGAGLQIVRCLGPFDSVINHFPASNAEVREQVRNRMAAKTHLGKGFADLLMQLPGVERAGRARLSRTDRQPGRMYSFLCERR